MKTIVLGLAALASLGITSSVYALPMVQGASNCGERTAEGRLKCETCYPDESGNMVCANCVKIGETSDGTTIW